VVRSAIAVLGAPPLILNRKLRVHFAMRELRLLLEVRLWPIARHSWGDANQDAQRLHEHASD
jgi:hypothetical protein